MIMISAKELRESIDIAEFSYRITELHNEYLKILREWAKEEEVF